MESAPLVSVVIPTFNRAYCLPETIASVLAQTHRHLEILLVDDGSTDGTVEKIAALWPAEPRLRVLRQANAGVSAARNRGMDAARGQFLALLDSDDTWLPWKLEVQLACLARYPRAVMVHSEMAAVDADGRVFDEQFLRAIYDGYQRYALDDIYPESCRVADFLPEPPGVLAQARLWCGDIFSHSLTGNLVHTSTILLRTTESGRERYDETLRSEETVGFHLRVAQRGPVAFLDAASTRYRRGRNDHLWNPDKGYPPLLAHEYNRRFLALVEPHIRAGGARMRVPARVLKATLANAYAWVAESALGVGRDAEALRHLLGSLRCKPWQPRLVARLIRNRLLRRIS
jgi:glycosyltransferase involved in cell wall biosynthesis